MQLKYYVYILRNGGEMNNSSILLKIFIGIESTLISRNLPFYLDKFCIASSMKTHIFLGYLNVRYFNRYHLWHLRTTISSYCCKRKHLNKHYDNKRGLGIQTG